MEDRLAQLLRTHERLYGLVCRDLTFTDVELMAQAGYHVLWLDMEHSPLSHAEAIRLGRTIAHLGMVPMVRIVELSRTHVQTLLDGGIQVIGLPDIRQPSEARRLVELGKYPPQGRRGVASTSAAFGFSLGSDPLATLQRANDATHLLVQIESDEGYEALDEILAVEGIDIISVGPNDWATDLGITGNEAKKNLTPKIERIITRSKEAGKTLFMMAPSPEQAAHHHQLGAHAFFVGVDIGLKREMLNKTIERYQGDGS